MYVPAGLSNVVTLASGSDHLLALRADGTVTAWGACWFPWGFVPSTVPAGLSNVVAIAGGENQSLALRADGTVVAWNSYNLEQIPVEATNVVAIAAGGYGTTHNVVVRADGSVVAWGHNASGQATVPAGLSNVVMAAAGGSHSLALRADGSVAAWGNHDFGQITVPEGLSNVAAVAAGKVFLSLALKHDGTIVPWGKHYDGFSYIPLSVPGGLSDVVAVSAGNYHAVALQADGGVRTWGYYHDGFDYLPFSTPAGVNSVVAITSGGNHAAAVSGPLAPFVHTPMLNQTAIVGTAPVFRVRVTGTRPLFFQWRMNGDDLPGETNPTLVLTNVTSGQAASYSVMVSNSVGTIVSPAAWLTVVPFAITTQPRYLTGIIGGPVTFTVGCESVLPLSYQWRFGDEGLPGETNQFLDLTNLTADQGGSYSVVISNSAGVITSSNAVLITVPLVINTHPAGQAPVLGATASLGANCQSYLPLSYQWRLNDIALPGATNNPLLLTNVDWSQKGLYSVLVTNSAGARTSSNALLRIASVATTLTNWGLSTALTAVPQDLTNAAAVAAGPNHALALWDDGSLAAWGQNDFGQASIPVEATNVIAIAAGGDHSLALRSDGLMVAWGKDDQGQATVPAGLSNVIALAAGANHSLALLGDGTVAAWGNNQDGQTTVPAALDQVVAVAAGTNHCLALRADGSVVAWGANNYGQTNVPVSLSNVVAVAGGAAHSLALQSGGTIAAWGSTYVPRTWIPITVPPGLTNITAIAAGSIHSLALRSDGTVFAWGSYNNFGLTNVPADLSNVIAVAAGGYRSLALVAVGGAERKLRVGRPAFGDSGFSVEVPTTCGRVYRLEYKNRLEETNWVALPLIPGIGVPRKLLDPTATNSVIRFYRVREW
jgi:alpha-tubulin suppressor-like RCC1 family protein